MSIITYNQATIAAGQSLSGETDLYPGTLVGIWMPPAWTAASLTFQVLSPDGSTWVELYNYAGAELTLTVAASMFLAVDPTQWKGVQSVQVRSGTAGSPVNQTAQAIVTLVTRQLLA